MLGLDVFSEDTKFVWRPVCVAVDAPGKFQFELYNDLNHHKPQQKHKKTIRIF